MAAFTQEQIAQRSIDVQALVEGHGIAVIDNARREACSDWLRQHDYHIEQLDCSAGMHGVLERLNELFQWVQQFGYRLSEGSRNLDALRDGFEFDVPVSGGLVFELSHPDVIWREDPRWLLGLLAIASEHSRYHLACGRRFFTLLVLPSDSPLIGQKFDDLAVPCAYWNPNTEHHNFVRS